VAFPWNSDPHILGIPDRDELRPVIIKDSLPSSSLAGGWPSPAFIGNDSRIELSYSINFFVGDQPIIQREMEGGEKVSMKELKETIMFLVKQLVELKGAFSKTASVSGFEAQRGSSSGLEPRTNVAQKINLWLLQKCPTLTWRLIAHPQQANKLKWYSLSESFHVLRGQRKMMWSPSFGKLIRLLHHPIVQTGNGSSG